MSGGAGHRLHVKDSSNDWRAVPGCRITSWSFDRPAVDATTSADGAWRRVLAGAGLRQLRVEAKGLLVEDGAAAFLHDLASRDEALRLRVDVLPELILAGQFVVVSLKVEGATDDEPTFAMTLISSGVVERLTN